MRRIGRLLHYMRPYTAQVMVSVLLMAVVGAMAAFRVLLIKPILDNVLSPASSPAQVLVFPYRGNETPDQSAGMAAAILSQCVDGSGRRAGGVGDREVDLRLPGNAADEQGRVRDDYGPAQ